jgi:hypothetical protein
MAQTTMFPSASSEFLPQDSIQILKELGGPDIFDWREFFPSESMNEAGSALPNGHYGFVGHGAPSVVGPDYSYNGAFDHPGVMGSNRASVENMANIPVAVTDSAMTGQAGTYHHPPVMTNQISLSQDQFMSHHDDFTGLALYMSGAADFVEPLLALPALSRSVSLERQVARPVHGPERRPAKRANNLKQSRRLRDGSAPSPAVKPRRVDRRRGMALSPQKRDTRAKGACHQCRIAKVEVSRLPFKE